MEFIHVVRQAISRYFLEPWLEWIIWTMILSIILAVTHLWKMSSTEVEIAVIAERVEWETGPISSTSILENFYFQQVDIKNFAAVQFNGKRLSDLVSDNYVIFPSENKIYGSTIRLAKPHEQPTNESPLGSLDGISLQEKYKVVKVVLEAIDNNHLRVEVSPSPVSPLNLPVTSRFQLRMAPKHFLKDSHGQFLNENEWRDDFELSKDNQYIRIQGRSDLLQLELGVLSNSNLKLYRENVGEGIFITALNFSRQSGEGIRTTLVGGKITYPGYNKPEVSINHLDLLIVEPDSDKQDFKIREITWDNKGIHIWMRGNVKRIGTSLSANITALDKDYRLTAYEKVDYLWQAMALIGSLPLVVMVSRLRRGRHKT